MDRQKQIILGCALVLVLLSCFVWYKTFNTPRETGASSAEAEGLQEVATTSPEAEDVSDRNEAASITQNAPLKVSVHGDRFTWPYAAVFTRTTTDLGIAENIELRNAVGQKVARGACGTFGYYEGPYDAEPIEGESRTFMRDGVKYTITYRTFENYRYASSTPLPLTGTVVNEAIVEVESEEAQEARKGVITWRADSCMLISYEGSETGISSETLGELKQVYNSWH